MLEHSRLWPSVIKADKCVSAMRGRVCFSGCCEGPFVLRTDVTVSKGSKSRRPPSLLNSDWMSYKQCWLIWSWDIWIHTCANDTRRFRMKSCDRRWFVFLHCLYTAAVCMRKPKRTHTHSVRKTVKMFVLVSLVFTFLTFFLYLSITIFDSTVLLLFILSL